MVDTRSESLLAALDAVEDNLGAIAMNDRDYEKAMESHAYEPLRTGRAHELIQAEKYEQLAAACSTDERRDHYLTWARIYRNAAEHYAQLLKERGQPL